MIVCQFAGLLKSIRGFYRTTIGDWLRCISDAGKEYNVVDGSLQTRLKYFKLLAKFIHVGNIMCRQNIRLFILAVENRNNTVCVPTHIPFLKIVVPSIQLHYQFLQIHSILNKFECIAHVQHRNFDVPQSIDIEFVVPTVFDT